MLLLSVAHPLCINVSYLCAYLLCHREMKLISMIEKDLSAAPYIVAFGETQDSLTDIKVIMERETIISFSSVSEALHYCFAAYYVFNISYPPPFKSLMIILETYVYGLKATSKEPLTVTIFKDSLKRL